MYETRGRKQAIVSDGTFISLLDTGFDEFGEQDFAFIERVRQCGRIAEPFAFYGGPCGPVSPIEVLPPKVEKAVPPEPTHACRWIAGEPTSIREHATTTVWTAVERDIILKLRQRQLHPDDERFITEIYHNIYHAVPVSYRARLRAICRSI